MHVRGLRKKIPADVRERGKQAGFADPDWYAGPLLDDPYAAQAVDLPPNGESEEDDFASPLVVGTDAPTDSAEKGSLVQRLVAVVRRRPRAVH